VSATVKTPCAASSLPDIAFATDRGRESLQRYIDVLTGLATQADLGWMAEPLDGLIRLFSECLTGK
jgi:hypothetical protein